MKETMLQRKREDAPSSKRIDGFRSILSYILNNAILVPEVYGEDLDTIANDLQKVTISKSPGIHDINSATDYSTGHTL